MPEYVVVLREIYHAYVYVDADNPAEAVEMVNQGGGDYGDSDYVEGDGWIEVYNRNTDATWHHGDHVPDDGDPSEEPVVPDDNPNAQFAARKTDEDTSSSPGITGENES